MDFLNILLGISLAAVLLVLIAGVVVMARGGETAKKWSNKLMRYRVAAQFAVVLLILLVLFIKSGGDG